MAWTEGPGSIKSITFGAQAVTADLLESFGITPDKDSYDSGLLHAVDRGSIKKSLQVNVYDVSAINPLNAIMKARTETDITMTYTDNATQVLENSKLRFTPLLDNVTDVCDVFIASSGTSNASLATSWTSLGVSLDVPTLSPSYPSDVSDGKGRPYYSNVGLEVDLVLPGDVYSSITDGAVQRLAFRLPDGSFQVMTGSVYKSYAADDGSRPRAVSVVLRAVDDDWGNIIEFTSGAAIPITQKFTDVSPTLIQNRLHGIAVEAVGFGYSEPEVTTF